MNMKTNRKRVHKINDKWLDCIDPELASRIRRHSVYLKPYFNLDNGKQVLLHTLLIGRQDRTVLRILLF